MTKTYRFYRPDRDVSLPTNKRPCQNNAVPGGVQCPVVAKWTIFYTMSLTDAHEHERRYCDRHVMKQLESLNMDHYTTSVRVEKIDYD